MKDLIERESARRIIDSPRTKQQMLAVLESLPPVQPEIIRCKDCKHWINGHLCESLSRFGSFETKEDFYCGYAKRRTDGCVD